MRALIIGDSGGIGAAVARTLRDEHGAEAVVGLSRREHQLDITSEASVVAALGQLKGPFDLVFVATGVLAEPGATPEKSLTQLNAEALTYAFEVNAVGPALLLKHLRPLLSRSQRSVVAVLSAKVGSIGDNRLGGWYSYRASKAALNQLVHSAAIEWRRTHAHTVLVCLHPGTVATAFTARYQGRHPTQEPVQAARHLLDVCASLNVDNSGQFYGWDGAELPW